MSRGTSVLLQSDTPSTDTASLQLDDFSSLSAADWKNESRKKHIKFLLGTAVAGLKNKGKSNQFSFSVISLLCVNYKFQNGTYLNLFTLRLNYR